MVRNTGIGTKTATAREMTTKKSNNVVIREIKNDELESAASLVARLKRLNGEFDPLLKASEEAETHALKTLRDAMGRKESVVLVAVSGTKVVGVVKAGVADRAYYEPRMDGAIVEFYILPEYRRSGLGKNILTEVTRRLKDKGAVLITAEFPSQNEMARRFYTRLGFRSLTNVYAREKP